MWATIAIIFVSLLVGYIISNQKEEKTLSETWREEHKNNAENRFMVLPSGGHFQKELCEFLEHSGYLSQPLEENAVAFLRENEKYLIRYFPEEGYIQLLKAYEWTDSEREEIACNAAATAMQYIRCCKVIVDGDTLLFPSIPISAHCLTLPPSFPPIWKLWMPQNNVSIREWKSCHSRINNLRITPGSTRSVEVCLL